MVILCNNCGRENGDGLKFCSGCGSGLQECSSEKSSTVIPQSNIMENSTGSELILISGGTFQMGSNKGRDDEKPVHSVTVDSFYISKYPVTNKEYKIFNPDHCGKWEDPDYPVETVSWYEAVEYCNWLSDRNGLKLCYSGLEEDNIKMDRNKNGYRLPSEAEWEYACRAGTTTEYYWGDEMDGDYCWYKENSNKTVCSVGQKKPNAWGLYDMSGNVAEWCWDWYNKNYYSNSLSDNPTGPTPVLRNSFWNILYFFLSLFIPYFKYGSFRVVRGGSWDIDHDWCRSACRFDYEPGDRENSLGFRLCRSVSE